MSHSYAQEHGINAVNIKNQNIQISHQALLMLSSLNFYDQQQVLKEIHFVVNNPNSACKNKPNASLFKRFYRTRYPFKNYHYLIEYKINNNNQVVISDIMFDYSMHGAKDKSSHERTLMYDVFQDGHSQYDSPKTHEQLGQIQEEWILGDPVSKIRTEHAAVNGMLNDVNKAAWLMGVHSQVAYNQDNVKNYTLFHNPTDNGALDILECSFDKRRGRKSHNAQHLAAVLHERQSQGKVTKWLVHSQGAIIFCAALEHYRRHYSGWLNNQEVTVHGSGSNLVRIINIARSVGVKIHKERNNPFDAVPNLAGMNDLSGSSLKRSLRFLGLIMGDESLASPHTLPYLGIETYKSQLQMLGYDKHASRVQKYINKNI